MIRGIGVDVVDVARFARSAERAPGLVPRLFAPAERSLPMASVHDLIEAHVLSGSPA